jgi:hypothetical protein
MFRCKQHDDGFATRMRRESAVPLFMLYGRQLLPKG